MEITAESKKRKAIANVLAEYGRPCFPAIVDEWIACLRGVGRCKNTQEAIELMRECFALSRSSGEYLGKASEAGKWIEILFFNREQKANAKTPDDRMQHEQREREERTQRDRINAAADRSPERMARARACLALGTRGKWVTILGNAVARGFAPILALKMAEREANSLTASTDANAVAQSNERTQERDEGQQGDDLCCTGTEMQTAMV